MDPKNHLLLILLLSYLTLAPAGAQTRSPDTGDQDLPVNFQFGYQAYQEGDMREALTRLQQVQASDTEYPRAEYWLSKTYYALGYNDSAVRIWRANDTGLEYPSWFERELTNHHLRYHPLTSTFTTDWEYIGLIQGDQYGRARNLNPGALERAPEGGWYSASYRLGKVLHYSEEGRVLTTWGGLTKPVDLHYDPRSGLLASEPGEGRISRLTDTGFVPLYQSPARTPRDVLSQGKRLFFYDPAHGDLVQFSRQGDTVGVVWSRSSGSRIEDVTVGPDRNFWALDVNNHRLVVVSPRQETRRVVSWDRNLSLRRIWWRKGKLIASGSSGLMVLDPTTGGATYVEAEGDTLAGGDLMGLVLRGNRVVLSSFNANQLLLYRTSRGGTDDLLVQERRTQFGDFPILRMNLILEDARRSHQFEHLTDQNVRVRIENQEVLPSFLRHSGEVYSRNWIILVDNRFAEPARWDEVEPYLRTVLDSAPLDSSGALWSVAGDQLLLEPFTEQHLLLANALDRINLYAPPDPGSDTPLVSALHEALNSGLARRGPTGVILVSTHLKRGKQRWERVAHRLRNNRVPLVTVDPSVGTLSEEHPLAAPVSRYQNLGSLEARALWDFYRDRLRNHYTVMFRSPLAFQPSSEWRSCEFVFQVLGRVQRHDCGYLLP